MHRGRRGKAAIRELREFAQRHMKSSQVKIGTALNRFILRDSISSPPRRVKVRAVKDDAGLVWLDLFGARPDEVEKAKPAEKPKAEKAKEEAKAEKEAQKKPLSEAEKKAEKEARKAEMKK